MHACTTFTLIHVYLYIGQSVPDKASSIISQLPSDVHKYVAILRRQYQHNPIVATDWLPRVGQSYFGRLGLVEKQGFDDETEKETSWHMLRGEVDKIPNLSGLKEIPIEEVLETKDSQSLRVVVDGPPGIGKTTLCHKLLNMWSNGEIKCQEYDLVLYCPLRIRKIATANNLTELLKAVYESNKVSEVVAWLSDREGKGLLIIFDGWDELDAQSRESSLAARIFCREMLDQCAVIITSRSYASSSLLEMDTHSKHVQVIGFSEEEVNTVIINTLQKDLKLAQELLVRMKECSDAGESFIAIKNNNKDSQLAVQLIGEVKIRTDVQSLCYIPLVCSMVIYVYRKEKKLPNTLTLLYETFILLTIKRHIKKRHSNIDHKRILSLNNLPSLLEQSFQEMCRLAYTSLKNESNKMTFSSDQLQDYSLSEVAKEDYLGLMTSFEDYEEWYQFIHLSIQEFLAAWWIAKHEEKTEEVFKDHFDDDHFRMCLRFVAGLTHLEHESYQQYFNKQLDLQCKTRPLFGFGALYNSYFTSSSITEHFTSDSFDKFPVFLLQLLYESQNTTLCQILAQFIKDSSLCLNDVQLSSFDVMCLSFFFENSKAIWNQLDLAGNLHIQQKQSIFIEGLTSNTLQNTWCKSLQVVLQEYQYDEIYLQLLQPSHLLYNIEECYFTCEKFSFKSLQIFNLPKLKILHLSVIIDIDSSTEWVYVGMLLEKSIKSNKTLKELCVALRSHQYSIQIAATVLLEFMIGIIRGLTSNRSVTLFSFSCHHFGLFASYLHFKTLSIPMPNGVIENLLQYNKTLKALSLGGPFYYSPLSLNIQEVNTPLTALCIQEIFNGKILASLLTHIKGLQCLQLIDPELHEKNPIPPHLIFQSCPSLKMLGLQLEIKNVAELFNILQYNTILKGLRVIINDLEGPNFVLIKDTTFTRDNIGLSLQDMLTHNQTLQCLEILIMEAHYLNHNVSAYMPFLISGLESNTSLQHLTAPVALSAVADDDDQLRKFFNIISQKTNLIELSITFTFGSLHQLQHEKENLISELFHKQVLPAVTGMLQSHTTMRLLELEFSGITGNTDAFDKTIQISHHTCTDQFRNFYKIIFNHVSLEYVKIGREVILDKSFKEQEKARVQQEAPH